VPQLEEVAEGGLQREIDRGGVEEADIGTV